MRQEYIDVADKKWGVVVVSDFDTDKERVELLAIMRSFGLSLYNAKRALNILSAYNTGMAVSVDSLRMSVIFISHATSKEEFWSTAIHELKHVTDAIVDYYGADWDEDAAYTIGYLTKELVEIIGEPCVG